MSPSTLIQSVVSKPSKRKDVFYEMFSTCPECEMRFTRRDNMKRHSNSRHENMKSHHRNISVMYIQVPETFSKEYTPETDYPED